MTSPEESAFSRGEGGPERILSRDEIIAEISKHCESFEPERELSDEQGIYLLEVKATDGSRRYTYQRKRLLPDAPQGIESSGTTLRSEDLDDGYSRTIADFNPNTGEWVGQ